MSNRFKNFKTSKKSPEVTPEEIASFLNPNNSGIDHSKPEWSTPVSEVQVDEEDNHGEKEATIARDTARDQKKFEKKQG